MLPCVVLVCGAEPHVQRRTLIAVEVRSQVRAAYSRAHWSAGAYRRARMTEEKSSSPSRVAAPTHSRSSSTVEHEGVHPPLV